MDVYQSVKLFLPELVLSGTSLLVLLFDLFKLNKKALGLLSLLGIAGTFFVLPTTIQDSHAIFSGLYLLDGIGRLLKLLVLLITGLVLLASIDSELIPEKQKGEFYVLMLALAFLLMVMGSSTKTQM